jgi:hypothetical protein
VDGAFLIIVWILCGAACAIIAQKKGRDQMLWFILGILGGILTLAVLALLPNV